jgi:diguanylate cyclase (GGDEF)-like protein
VDESSSIVGLTIQWAGIVLVMVLSGLLTQSIRRRYLDYWTAGWSCLTLSLSALLIAFILPVQAKAIFYGLYVFTEYAAGFLFVAGCRNLASGTMITSRDRWFLVPLVVIPVVLPGLHDDINALMIFHSFFLALFWIWAFFALTPARRKSQSGPGLRVVSVALILLALNFLHYVPVYFCSVMYGQSFPYMHYSSLYNLILEILLAFGTVMLVTESARQELEIANRELAEASAQLRILAEQDPLTAVLNRHAFYSLVEKKRRQPDRVKPGCVTIVDINDFKSINDTRGHAAGDAAIRAVAKALRGVIRADDLLFRWGGDEFLILLPGLDEADARGRLEGIDHSLQRTRLSKEGDPVDLSVSYGLASFEEMNKLDLAIEQADLEMYKHKQSRRQVVAEPGEPQI